MGHSSARTPGIVSWPEKLITQAEAFVLAADWPVYAQSVPHTGDGDRDVNLYCRKNGCDQQIAQMLRSSVVYNGSLDELLSATLRHMVMAHDVPLAGLRKGVDES